MMMKGGGMHRDWCTRTCVLQLSLVILHAIASSPTDRLSHTQWQCIGATVVTNSSHQKCLEDATLINLIAKADLQCTEYATEYDPEPYAGAIMYELSSPVCDTSFVNNKLLNVSNFSCVFVDDSYTVLSGTNESDCEHSLDHLITTINALVDMSMRFECDKATQIHSLDPPGCIEKVTCVVGKTYEFATPILASPFLNPLCFDVTPCLATQYQVIAPTLTTNAVCDQYTICPDHTYESVAATPTSDVNCSECQVGCPEGAYVMSTCNATNNLECMVMTLTSGQDAGGGITDGGVAAIVIIVLLLFAAAVSFAFVYGRSMERKTQKQLEGQELLLAEAHQSNSRMLEDLERQRAAWQIPESHLCYKWQVAEGSFGTVWKGEWGGQTVAIKILKVAFDRELPLIEEDYKREIEALKSIRHPHLLIFYGAGETADKRPFFVTQFMERGSLRSILLDKNVEMDWSLKQKIAKDIADGIAHLHKISFVHRDLKSDNCLCDAKFNTKVADFGTSKFLLKNQELLSEPFSPNDADTEEIDLNETSFVSTSAHAMNNNNNNNSSSSSSNNNNNNDNDDERSSIHSSRTSKTSAAASMTRGVGTLLWMAPELLKGNTHYGPEVDLYSYGIIMWEILMRQEPWEDIKQATYITFFEKLVANVRRGQRPVVDAETRKEHSAYCALMEKCWADDAQSRPSFATVLCLFDVLER